jgi:hypothetical protein
LAAGRGALNLVGSADAVLTPPDSPSSVLRQRAGAACEPGLLGVLVLTLGVFGGAPEHVISGSALLVFTGAGPYLLS